MSWIMKKILEYHLEARVRRRVISNSNFLGWPVNAAIVILSDLNNFLNGWQLILQLLHFMLRSKTTKFIIMGPPGSGKGTISERILKDFKMNYLATGNMLRNEMSQKTDLGLEAKKYIDFGKLVPDQIITGVVLNKLAGMKNENWLLDGQFLYIKTGFPRTIQQANAILENEEINAVLNLDIPFQVIVDRIRGRWTHVASGRVYHTEFNPPKVPGKDDESGDELIQREDDKEATVRARLDYYNTMTKPLLEYFKFIYLYLIFRGKNLLVEFRGKYSNEIWPHVHAYIAQNTSPLSFTTYN
ncbi:GTP:AMP phosphotransferase AK3, mitochondrial-like [Octopus sinensis]|uniref:GTP:AMP phosphotransferase AK3, mitochondrial-like n=1 Tax=Octopus sinensis TaxID=2607531 RepID=A0A6P7U644_9MOLL|nr:GTP:AMP phosphotransferase AK3, mitochondrial-like [Octopus sinensis]